MKNVFFSIPFCCFFFCCSSVYSQQLQTLPGGEYIVKEVSTSWKLGNIRLKPEGFYTVSNDPEPGEYKFSVAGQRVFFTSGPLKGSYAITRLEKNLPTIVFLASEPQPFTTASDVLAQWKQ